MNDIAESAVKLIRDYNAIRYDKKLRKNVVFFLNKSLIIEKNTQNQINLHKFKNNIDNKHIKYYGLKA